MTVSELMLQIKDTFGYLHCSGCGCLSLLDIPNDMSQYYPSSYYSFVKESTIHKNTFTEKLKKILRKSSMKGHLEKGNFINKMISKARPIYYTWLKKGLLTLDSKILDVGCGNGFLITELERYGFTNLYGIDLFINRNESRNTLKIYQTDIHAFKEDKFDLIMYHHSFEHIPNPHLELATIYNKLDDSGTLMIRVPVCDSYAFRQYKENWVQLDAPRHYFLYTRKSMQILAEQNGFKINDYMYDSNAFQLSGSECYARKQPLSSIETIFSEDELNKYEKKSRELNEAEDGDSICFYLNKIV